jgi:N-acetylmuramoyl-L-alanine amidase
VRLRVIPLAAAAATLIAPAAASASFAHVVAEGESLSSVAASDGLTVEELANANGLSPEASLLTGSTLTIPAQAPGEAGEGETSASQGETASSEHASAAGGGSYLVQPGDTLSAIAERAGTSVQALASANGIDPNAPLLSGTALTLPGGAGEASSSEGSAATEGRAAPTAASEAGEGVPEGPPFATAEKVTPSEVGSIATENGVPASLADAIAEQESGFDNSVTSSAGAHGVMQIMPETWSFIGQELAGPGRLAPDSATDNVRGGVLLLHSLLQATGGDTAQAIAAYYQGLASVQEEGELPETEEYVSSVQALQRQFGGE